MASRTSKKAETSSIVGPASTVQPLAAERDRLMKSPAFLDKKNPKHREVMERYKTVTEKLYGGGTTSGPPT